MLALLRPARRWCGKWTQSVIIYTAIHPEAGLLDRDRRGHSLNVILPISYPECDRALAGGGFRPAGRGGGAWTPTSGHGPRGGGQGAGRGCLRPGESSVVDVCVDADGRRGGRMPRSLRLTGLQESGRLRGELGRASLRRVREFCLLDPVAGGRVGRVPQGVAGGSMRVGPGLLPWCRGPGPASRRGSWAGVALITTPRRLVATRSCRCPRATPPGFSR